MDRLFENGIINLSNLNKCKAHNSRYAKVGVS